MIFVNIILTLGEMARRIHDKADGSSSDASEDPFTKPLNEEDAARVRKYQRPGDQTVDVLTEVSD